MVELGIGKSGNRVSYWLTEGKRCHSKTGKVLPSYPLETTTEPYWAEHYVGLLDTAYRSILGIEKTTVVMPQSSPVQLKITFY